MFMITAYTAKSKQGKYMIPLVITRDIKAIKKNLLLSHPSIKEEQISEEI